MKTVKKRRRALEAGAESEYDVYPEKKNRRRRAVKTKDLTLRFAVIQLCFWTSFAAIVAFSSYYLLDKGMTNTEIGIVIAIAGTVAALLQPVTGAVMDKFPRMTSSGFLAVIFAMLAADALVLILLPDLGTLPTGILYGFMIMTVQLTQSLLNVVGVDSMGNGNRLNFNIARAAGSGGYAAAAWGLGALTVLLPPVLIPVTIAFFSIAVAIMSGVYPIRKSDGKETDISGSLGPVAFLKHYPVFFLLLPALTMIYFSHAVLNTFTLQIMNSLGAGSAEMGTATAVAAACEMITVIGFAVLRKKFSIRTLLRLSGAFFLVKNVMSLLAASVAGFYAAQTCQLFSWGIMCVAIVYYVNETVPAQDRAKGQTYAGMTLTVANVTGAVFGGRIIDTGGIRALMLLAAVICACGVALLFLATGEKKTKTLC